uniref:CASP-like protein 1 n=1 Tax=Panax ginseng TaxID=4054 RepID=CSPL1_PANGI|nr:RecName: Full=CASP-like protein 1 [Panax ginseng]ABD73297.1 unknown [Panax ginseng]
MVTGKQTELIPIPFPPYQIPYSSKFTDSPAFIYFVAAFSVAGLYSIITSLLSGLALLKPGYAKQLVSHFVVVDVLLLGIVAAAIGAAGGVGYIGLRGNSHSRWTKICNIYDTFCQHLAGSIAAGLIASIVLVLLILLSFFTLSRKIPK